MPEMTKREDETLTEFTMRQVKAEWIDSERRRILNAINAIDPIEWAIGAAYDMVVRIVVDQQVAGGPDA